MTAWVLLRGWMRDARHWGEFLRRFQQSLGADHRVLTLDFPGNGPLHAQRSPLRVEAMADYCHSQLGQSGCPPPYGVLALSLGAMVAVAWNELHPGELERMALINTSLAPCSPFYHRLRPRNYAALVSGLFRGATARREELVMRLTSNIASQSGQRHAILGQWVSYAQEHPPARANMLRQLIAAARYRGGQTPPSIPVLLLGSAQDRLVDVRSTLALARQWDCPVRLHPASGHDLPLDDGDWVAQQVTEWLNRKTAGKDVVPQRGT